MSNILDPVVNVYLKRHTKTGKLYFGKTINTDTDNYKGSGSLWKRHCNKHGWDYIENVFVYSFDNADELKEFCLFFSDFYDIVDSDRFSNLMPEDGFSGGNVQIVKFINKSGEIIHLDKIAYTTNKSEDEWVKLQSNEGRRRAGTTKQHKNAGTCSVFDKEDGKTKRILKELMNSDPERFIGAQTEEYYKLIGKEKPKRMPSGVLIVDIHGNKTLISQEEYRTGKYISAFELLGRKILGKSIVGNKKNLVTGYNISGDVKSITKEEYWKQEEIYGGDRSKWDWVHPTHPEGKIRKRLKIC